MSINETTGNVTADGSEQTLATETTAGVYVLWVDLSNLADGDSVILRLKSKVRSSSTSRQVYSAAYANAQADDNVQSNPMTIAHEAVATLEQDGGVNRTYDWSLLRVD